MSAPIIYVGGTRHLTPGNAFGIPTLTLVPEAEVGTEPPYTLERYVRTTLKVDVGSPLGDATVYVLDTGTYDRADLQATLDAFMAEHGGRIREHFRFLQTGTGRPWGRE